MEHPFFSVAALPRRAWRRELAREARIADARANVPGGRVRRSWGEKLAIHNHRKGGLQMAKKAKGGKKKAAKKR